jgi:hypothetical protein
MNLPHMHPHPSTIAKQTTLGFFAVMTFAITLAACSIADERHIRHPGERAADRTARIHGRLQGKEIRATLLHRN